MISRSDALVIREQIYAQLAQMVELLLALRVERRSQADGYPRQSLSEGSPRNEVDDDGTPVPQHTDPTAQAVIARNEGQSGHLARAEKVMERAFLDCRRICESAIGGARNALEPPKEPPAALKDGELGCTNHAQVKVDGRPCWEPVYEKAPTSGLCRWCYDHWRADGRRPPREVVAIHVERGPREAGLWFARQAQQQGANA